MLSSEDPWSKRKIIVSATPEILKGSYTYLALALLKLQCTSKPASLGIKQEALLPVFQEIVKGPYAQL